jgi:hypothetical protein
MLAQFALIAFAIFGVLALVIDAGYVRLTQVQMQNAADAASLEGLRLRNLRADGFESDCKRRTAANRMAAWTFDDDFDLSADALQLGAGPNVSLTAGIGRANALQTIELDDPRVYKPALQHNQLENLQHGDMVSGTFTYTSSATAAEDSDYVRVDFTPAAPVPPGASGLPGCPADDDFAGVPESGNGAVTDNAFLVRMRRTNNFDDLDEVPDVSSRGQPLPLLFGRGTTIEGSDSPGDYSVRHHGLTVRSTAIAAAAPVLRVGVARFGKRGSAPFALDRTFYEDQLTPNDLKSFTISPDGEIENAGHVVGQFAPADPHSCDQDAADSEDRARCTLINTVGLRLPELVQFACTTVWDDAQSYGPVYEPIGDGPLRKDRIVGFGRVTWSLDCTAGPPFHVLLGRRTVPWVAAANATAVMSGGLPPDLPPTAITDLWNKVRSFAELTLPPGASTHGAWLAPVLAR